MTTRRDRLFDVAADHFVRFGFRKASISGITHEAKVSKGALYLEFATKDDLFTQVVYREFRLYLQDALARVQNDPEGGRLSRIYRHCLAALLQREFLVSLYTDTDGALTGLLVQHGPERYGPRVVLGETFLARLQQAGLVTPTIPAASLSHTLSVLTTGPLLAEPLLRREDSPPLRETLGAISDMISTSFEISGPDVSEGKEAFADLVQALISELDPERLA